MSTENKKYQSPMLIAEEDELSVEQAAPADGGAILTAAAVIAAAVWSTDCSSEDTQSE